MATLAGFWGPETILWSTSGTPARDTPVTVLSAATLLPTTLYSDESKAVTVANPVNTDLRGNLSFFAVPGEYKLRWDGTTSDLFVVVGVHPDDPAGGGGGVTDHGGLTGLADDDHPQYMTQAEGDARYYTETEMDTLLAGKAGSSHTHPSSQITDFSSAVDARIANVIGTAPANLDTLGELADALNDDANFAATVTALLATKAPLSNPTFTGTVSGVTKAMVGLGNVSNLAPADMPVSTAQQTALDAKAPRAYVTDTMTKYGILACPGPFSSFQGPGGFTNQWVICRCLVPANSGALTRMTIPVRAASTNFTTNGQPNQLAWWDDDGVLQSVTPDDSDMWDVADWYVATLATAVPNSAVDRYVYGGMHINGQTGVQQFVLTNANDAGGIPFSHAPGSSKRFCAYSPGTPALASFNPNTVGTLTSFMPFLGFLA